MFLEDRHPAVLRGESLSVSYESRRVFKGLDLSIPEGQITVIVGPNACGKSSLLRTLSRLLVPEQGQVLLRDREIHRYGSREVARILGLLPQSSSAPAGICVADLVARGRFPHQTLLRQWTAADEQAVAQAMQATGVHSLADATLEELSGGQRQRVWLAMLLAQETPVMLLDEPTTWLDICHQLEVLELCRRLNREQGRTLVMVLHDLNQAARYADYLVAMKAGEIVAAGAPERILTAELVERVFSIRARIETDPVTGCPWVLPIASVGRMDDGRFLKE
ncbi:iron-dicitrate transporter ATP-binding subunit [Marinobacter lutaoensis]|uniref:Iron-dicitrate transporter ATP-binding subunit n=2 Tax=Marinobacter lutaoensis TaxID=135739 RepID=A0A1V2DUL4_9GAMM|nr:ABC transporter ATP-binding protein [Marinobacter lutaoensis]ONF44277.1 iron-dicitrate transporter ATP-binding subunit [Marinobacter lutaoensis]